jgi:cytochrome oxidase Cu insertion factor (SCO1/SenC/PrrC family)
MPGMSSNLNSNDPTVVSAFQTALLHQGLVVLVILAIVGISWNVLRSIQLRRSTQGQPAQLVQAVAVSAVSFPEPTARRVLRISFGLVWIFDGLLQGQLSMPLGLVSQGVQPTASASPDWVQQVVSFGTRIWEYHPVPAAAASVWIQIGIGVWLLVAPRGYWSRFGGLASVGWGLIVWIFGESFGGIFAPGSSWLFGTPGAVLFYCAAGALVALPERLWAGPRLGKLILRSMGAFFLGMALLQAWPGRGFWQGRTASGDTGAVTSMAKTMSQTPQPHFLSSWVAAFAAFDAAHGWAVNLFVVIALVGIGVSFVIALPDVVRVGVLCAVVLCLADWVLVQDLGFLGGTGTDPNSMIPMALVFVCGYLALVRSAVVDGKAVVPISAPFPSSVAASSVPASSVPASSVAAATTSAAEAPGSSGSTSPTPERSWIERLAANPTYALRSIAALGALGVVLLGAVPMAAAATNPNADQILYQATNGTPNSTNSPAPAFSLTDQHGRPVSLASLRGKTIGLTFLDPVCTSDCPVIAQEFRIADGMLGAQAKSVELIAIDANPRYLEPAFLRAFDQQEGLNQLPNWLYLTGSLEQVQAMWNAYGVQVDYEPGGAMIAHSDFACVIDAKGHTRYLINADPGPASSASKSSFAVTLTNALKSAMSSS